jgi:PTS system cellobiose-specific IIB component
MVKIVVVCAAGASSTFLARRLSVLSSAAGLEWDVTPASGEGIRVSAGVVVAVNFHVATPTLRDALIAQGAHVVVLPEGVSGTFGAESAMATLRCKIFSWSSHHLMITSTRRIAIGGWIFTAPTGFGGASGFCRWN